MRTVEGSVTETKHVGCNCKTPAPVTVKRGGEVVERKCCLCGSPLTIARIGTGLAPVVHMPIGAVVEKYRGHLKSYRRDLTGAVKY